MISYREEYFKSFLKEDILKSSSFATLKKKLDSVQFYGPLLEKENDGFVGEAKQILDVIASIIRKPHSTIKDEQTIVRSSQAANIDTQSFIDTISDSSLWKRKNGVMKPEMVHINAYDVTFVLYENIFICDVLNFIKRELDYLYKIYEKRINTFDNVFENTVLTFGERGLVSSLGSGEFPYKGILSDEKENIHYKSKTVNHLLKRCTLMMNTSFYKEVKLAKAKRKNVVMTNILLRDKRYNLCYKFYKNYHSGNPDDFYMNAYRDYLYLRIIKDLKENYTFSSTPKTIKINYDKEMVFEKPICLHDKFFKYIISKEEDGFKINVSNLDSEETAEYFILTAIEVSKDNLKQLESKIKNKALEGYDFVVVMTARNTTANHRNILTISFNEEDDTKDGIKNLFKSFSMIFSCDFKIYQENCPVCSSKGVKRSGLTFKCGECGSAWSKVDVQGKSALWLKVVGRSSL